MKNSSQPKKSTAKSGKMVKFIDNQAKHDNKWQTKQKHQIQMTLRKTKVMKTIL